MCLERSENTLKGNKNQTTPPPKKTQKAMPLKNFWSEIQFRNAVLAKITCFHVAEISENVCK